MYITEYELYNTLIKYRYIIEYIKCRYSQVRLSPRSLWNHSEKTLAASRMDQPRKMPMVPPMVATRVGRSSSGLSSSMVTSVVAKYT